MSDKFEFYDITSSVWSEDHLTAVTFVNPFSYYDISPSMLGSIDYFFSDGILLTMLNNAFNPNKIERVSFDSTSVAYDFFKICVDRNLSVALVGAKPNEIVRFSNFIKTKFPDLNINYISPGYFSQDERMAVVSSCLKCDVVVVGMGFPFQEHFLLELKKVSSPSDKLRLALTCGGFFTQHQHKDYYPFFCEQVKS